MSAGERAHRWGASMTIYGDCRASNHGVTSPPIPAAAIRGQGRMHKAFRSVLILAAVLFALFVPPRGFAADTSAADSDAIFNYAEAIYSQYLSPSGATSQSDGYY